MQIYYRDKASQIYRINLSKYCHTKWRGYIQLGSIGWGVSKAEGKWEVTEKGKECVGNVKLDLSFYDGWLKYI